MPKASSRSAIQRRFSNQKVYIHSSSVPSDELREKAVSGKAVLISGEALAAAEEICKWAGHSEAFWYWTAASETPWRIDGLIIPKQRATSGGCYVDGSSVLKAARQARSQGQVIVGAGHSHGLMSCFVSRTDAEQLVREAEEGVCISRHADVASLEGDVGELLASEEGVSHG